MRPLWLTLLQAAGRGRALLVMGPTALVTGLLLVALSIVRLPGWGEGNGARTIGGNGLIGPITDPGTRGGAALAAVLLTLPLLLLLDQAVRVGSSERERRYTALAVAGATRSDRRRWGAAEVGLPALAGGVLGVPVWLALRLLLGTLLAPAGVALVPTETGPGWWAVLVVAVVGVLGALIGVRQGSREAAVLPDAASLRGAPAWWPALLMVPAVALTPVLPGLWGGGGLFGIVALVLLVAGLAGLAPFLAWATARAVAPRLSSPAGLIAVRRLAADPGPAGRAAAAVGAIALVCGVLGPFIAGVVAEQEDAGYYTGPAAVVGGCAAVALLVVCATLAVHSTESVLQRRREMASMVATGVPASVIGDSQRIESLVATLPLALLGSVLGALGYGTRAPGMVLAGLLAVVVTVLVVAGAAVATTAFMRPWVADAVRPDHLRTE